MKPFARVALCLTFMSGVAGAQVNAGHQKPEPELPFTMTPVVTFNLPWRIAFLPDGRMLITEKVGPVWLVTQQGTKTPVKNVPAVLAHDQGGMLGVYLSPNYKRDHNVYLTYSEPHDSGSSLALARAKLSIGPSWASLDGLKVIWRDGEGGKGGQFGAAVAFSPDRHFMFLTVGERQRMTPAQDPNSPLGKILRLTLDGKPAPGNPQAGKTGARSIPVINPPRNTALARTAPVVYTYTFPGPNLTPSETWATGFRTPYGLAFAPDGRLWEVEHGPRGGDELNLIEPGRNYGWPIVSYGANYDGVPISSPDSLPNLVKPVIYWTPVIAPGSLTFYNGKMFPQWNGSAFVCGLSTKALVRITFDNKGGATAVDRWDLGHQIRDVAVAPDGALWMIENTSTGALYRV
ncbi:MAG: PQQ-dependent sugar dehydrogenase, partial [Gemmatimonadota bacterium]|nr:PQQ-dependent sugar dehydrogenase [Gemmatimonadota bacterium]